MAQTSEHRGSAKFGGVPAEVATQHRWKVHDTVEQASGDIDIGDILQPQCSRCTKKREAAVKIVSSIYVKAETAGRKLTQPGSRQVSFCLAPIQKVHLDCYLHAHEDCGDNLLKRLGGINLLFFSF